MLVTLDTIMEIYKTLTKNVTKKDPCEGVNNISHSTYCAAREWSFDLLNFCFLKYFCYHGNIKSQNPILVQPGGNFFKFHVGCCVCILPILLPSKKMLVSSPTRKSIVVNIIKMTATYLLKPFNFKVFIDFWPWCV